MSYRFHPGMYIADELRERRLAARDLNAFCGYRHGAIEDLLRGNASITPDSARQIGAFFGTSDALWLRIQDAYDALTDN